MYDAFYEKFYSTNKQNHILSLDEVSQDFIASIIAIEDHRFFSHRGFDPIGILRALKNNVSSFSLKEGASTITQQYARLLYLNNERTWTRKIKEAFLSMRLETHYSKEEILTGYINSVYFGHGIYGLYNASHYYFNKDPIDLSLNEASMLAGVINGPRYYSPFLNRENAKKRQEKVLKKLVDYHYIDEKTKDETLKMDFVLNQDPLKSIDVSYQYYKDTVLDELEMLGFSSDTYIQQGLHIYTSFQPTVQQELYQIINKNITKDKDLQISYLINKTDDGGVIALVGGRDYSQSQFNRATKANRQIASTIKPLLYYQAIEAGFTANTKFKSEQTTFKLVNGTSYSPANYNQKYANKEITLAQAIAVSDNIYAVKTHLFLGEQSLVQFLNKFDITHVSPHPSLALGTFQSNIYELSQIYTTIANQGLYNQIHTIEKITNDNGDILYQRKKDNIQKLSNETCLILSQLLTSPFHKEFNTYAQATMSDYKVNTTYACKSGTSDFDSLCVGYNPQYVLLGWVGYDDNKALTSSLCKRVPKVVFQHMANYLSKEDCWYSLNDHLQALSIHPLTGEYDKNGIVYWFKK